MASTQLIVLFVLHSKATIWLCYFFRKHEETECKRWMISNDIRLHGGRWYWHEFKKPQTFLNWEGKSRVKDGRVLAHLESVIVIQAQFHIIGRSPFQLSVARSRKLVCAYFSRWLEYSVMKARPSLSSQGIIDVAQRKFIILKMRANIKRGCDIWNLSNLPFISSVGFRRSQRYENNGASHDHNPHKYKCFSVFINDLSSYQCSRSIVILWGLKCIDTRSSDLKGVPCQCCVVYFVYNACYASLFAMKLGQLSVSDKIYCSPKQLLQTTKIYFQKLLG